ncbi:MAG: DUF2157 domain-containing protein [Treponema sp.]|nr:DUF2157 domain-containing protein [Treponema sp.]
MTEYYKWLFDELKKLVSKKVISSRTAEKIKSYYLEEQTQKKNDSEPYTFSELNSKSSKESDVPAVSAQKHTATKLEKPKKEKKPVNVAVLLSVIAGILIGTGVISLIAYNWSAIGRPVRAVAAYFMIAVIPVILLVLKLKKPENVNKVINEFLGITWSLLFAGSLIFVSQTFRLQSNLEVFLFIWAIISFGISALLSSKATFILSVGVTCFFIGDSGITRLWLPFYACLGAICYGQGKDRNFPGLKVIGLIILCVISTLSSIIDLWSYWSFDNKDFSNPEDLFSFCLSLPIILGFLSIPVLRLYKKFKEKSTTSLDWITSLFPVILFTFVLISNIFPEFSSISPLCIYILEFVAFIFFSFCFKTPLLVLPLSGCILFSNLSYPLMVWPVFILCVYLYSTDMILVHNGENSRWKKFLDYGILAGFILLFSIPEFFEPDYFIKDLNFIQIFKIYFTLISIFAGSVLFSVKNKTFYRAKFLGWAVYLMGTVFISLAIFKKPDTSYVPLVLMITLIPVACSLIFHYKNTLIALLPFIPVIFNTESVSLVSFSAIVITLSGFKDIFSKIKDDFSKSVMEWINWGLLATFVFTFTIQKVWIIPEYNSALPLIKDFGLCLVAVCTAFAGFIKSKKISLFRLCLLFFSVLIAGLMVSAYLNSSFIVHIPLIIYIAAAVVIPVVSIIKKNPYIPLTLIIPALINKTSLAITGLAAILLFCSVINNLRKETENNEKKIFFIVLRIIFVILLSIIGEIKVDADINLQLYFEFGILAGLIISSTVLFVLKNMASKNFDIPLLGLIVTILSVFYTKVGNLTFANPVILKSIINFIYCAFGIYGFIFTYKKHQWDYLPYALILPAITIFSVPSAFQVIYIFTLLFAFAYIMTKGTGKNILHICTAILVLICSKISDYNTITANLESNLFRISSVCCSVTCGIITLTPFLLKFKNKEKFDHVIPFACLIYSVFAVCNKCGVKFPENFIPVSFLIMSFMISIFNLYIALKTNSFARTNLAAGYMLLAIITRFFDDSISFVAKGILFILVGVIILIFNIVILKKKKSLVVTDKTDGDKNESTK